MKDAVFLLLSGLVHRTNKNIESSLVPELIGSIRFELLRLRNDGHRGGLSTLHLSLGCGRPQHDAAAQEGQSGNPHSNYLQGLN